MSSIAGYGRRIFPEQSSTPPPRGLAFARAFLALISVGCVLLTVVLVVLLVT